jgi:hypothetical protein
MPECLTTGIMYLLPKSVDTKEPKNYKLITYLSTMYKTLTESHHICKNNLLLVPSEQTGCHSGSKGCKDQLLLSKAIFEDCQKRGKNLNIAWIDY